MGMCHGCVTNQRARCTAGVVADLSCIRLQAFTRANPGFVYDYQFIDVGDGPDGRGESSPVR